MDEKEWQAQSMEIMSGMKEWRGQHPKATMREIEMETMERMAKLQARMIQDIAMTTEEEGEERVICLWCGAEVTYKGKRERILETREGQEIRLERKYVLCPECGQGFFPPG
jgi:uncharacterized protein with PIN domain